MEKNIRTKEDLARSIRIAMAELNMSRKELANATGYSMRLVNSMCNGKHDFTIKEACQLENVLYCKLLIVPDKERQVVISMSIDSGARLCATRMSILENGKEKTDWQASELIATAKIMQQCSVDLMEDALDMSYKQPNVSYVWNPQEKENVQD